MRLKGIYLIDCGTEPVYIGQSINIEERLCQHKSKLKLNSHYNYKLQNEFNITGVFNTEILCLVNNEDLLYEKECYYIDMFDAINNGLNIAEAGRAGRGVNHGSSVYSKQSIVDAAYLLLDIDNKIVDISKSTGVSESTVRHISRCEVHTSWLSEEYPEVYAKLYLLSKNRVRNSSQRNKSKRYSSYTLISPDGSYHTLEGSLKDFAHRHNLDQNKLGQVMLGNRNTHKGWRLGPAEGIK